MGYGNFITTRPALILLSGLPGSGKTTFAKALAQSVDFAHIESDAVRRAMAARPTYSHSESGAVFTMVELEARRALSAGRHALIDATNLTNRDRKRFLQLAIQAGAFLGVRIVAPEAVIRARLAEPREGYSQATLEIFERMKGRPEPFSGPSVVVDSRFALDPSVALIRALVNAPNG